MGMGMGMDITPPYIARDYAQSRDIVVESVGFYFRLLALSKFGCQNASIMRQK